MRVLLTAVNAKYIHTSLSVRTLYHYIEFYGESEADTKFCEFTINENKYDVMRAIYAMQPDAVLFSCYIWNIGFILDVAEMLRAARPEVEIILGGPEVTYDSRSYMEKYPFIDAIMRGEGENVIIGWMRDGISAKGLTVRTKDGICENEDADIVHNITEIPFPYDDGDLEKNKNKLFYYESSRGCPYNCSYCLSSTVRDVRFRDIDTVKNELMRFIDHGVNTVKFVDRTFNADPKRTAEMIRFLSENHGNTIFHFEIAADILTDEVIDLLRKAPRGVFRIEAGIQSTNEKALDAVARHADLEKIKRNIKLLDERKNLHIHLDLIAGLPYEDIRSFAKSFDDVFAIGSDEIQLGFLKLLRGTRIRRETEKFGYRYQPKPPYEVFANDFISFEDIMLLGRIENVFDKYYNSGAFVYSLRYLMQNESSPFAFFARLAEYFAAEGYDKIALSRDKLYEILAAFSADEILRECLRYDYILCQNKLPPWDKTSQKKLNSRRFEILTDEFIKENIPEYAELPVKEIIKKLVFSAFDYDTAHNYIRRSNVVIFGGGRVITLYDAEICKNS